MLCKTRVTKSGVANAQSKYRPLILMPLNEFEWIRLHSFRLPTLSRGSKKSFFLPLCQVTPQYCSSQNKGMSWCLACLPWNCSDLWNNWSHLGKTQQGTVRNTVRMEIHLSFGHFQLTNFLLVWGFRTLVVSFIALYLKHIAICVAFGLLCYKSCSTLLQQWWSETCPVWIYIRSLLDSSRLSIYFKLLQLPVTEENGDLWTLLQSQFCTWKKKIIEVYIYLWKESSQLRSQELPNFSALLEMGY